MASKNSEEVNHPQYNLIPSKLFASLLSLYFYSYTPQKTFDSIGVIPSDPKLVRPGGLHRLGTRMSSRKNTTLSKGGAGSTFYQESEISSTTNIGANKGHKNKNLEDFIFIKLEQCEIFLVDYDIDKGIIEYCHKDTRKNYKFKFKHNSMKDKNCIRCLIFIEEYKFSIKIHF